MSSKTAWVKLLVILLLIHCSHFSINAASFGQTESSDKQAEQLTAEGKALFQQNKAAATQAGIEKFKAALPLWQASGNREKEAETLEQLGTGYFRLGDSAKSLEAYKQMLTLAESLKKPYIKMDALNGMGLAYTRIRDKELALSSYNAALPIARELADKLWIGRLLGNIGAVYNHFGENQKAIEYFQQSLPLRREVGDRGGEAATLNNIGGIYIRLGQEEKALDFYLQALPIRREVKDRAGEAATLSNLGNIYLRLEQLEKSAEYFQQSLQLTREVGDRALEANALHHLGVINLKLAHYKETLEYDQQALKIIKSVGDRIGELSCLTNLGDASAGTGDKAASISYFQQALSIAKAINNPPALANTLYRLARQEAVNGNLNDALTDIAAAVKHVEFVRTNAGAPDLKLSYFAIVQQYYELYIELLMRRHQLEPQGGYDAQALQISEMARARSLLDSLRESGVELRKGVDANLLAQEKELQDKLNAKALEQATRRIQSNEQLAQLSKDLDQLLNQFLAVQAEIRAQSPNYAAITQPQPLQIKELQQLLDDNTLLLEYWLAAENSYLWVVSKTAISSYQLPKKSQLDPLIKSVYELLIAPTRKVKFETPAEKDLRIKDAQRDYPIKAGQLSALLLAPVAEKLINKRLVIVSHGALQYIPFAALPIPSKREQPRQTYHPLVIDHEIIALPSASILSTLRARREATNNNENRLAILADPVFDASDSRVKTAQAAKERSTSDEFLSRAGTDLFPDEQQFPRLIGARKEAESIFALVNNEKDNLIALDFNASHDAVNSDRLRDYQYIHLATHGLINEIHPELSGLVLSLVNENGDLQNGFLRLNELYNLNLPAKMVVLSACQTGLGKEIKGEGIISLTRGFMYAGSARVVYSLWNINDNATTELMTNFYRNVLKAGMSPATALRKAQLSMLNDKKLAAPFYWAAFQITGD